MTTIKLIAMVRARTKTGTVYAAAKLLGITMSAVQRYAAGKGLPDAYGCLRIAEVLAIPLEQVIATVEAERATDPDKREAWKNLARKFQHSGREGGFMTTSNIEGRQPSSNTGGDGHADDLRAETSEELRPRGCRIICNATTPNRRSRAKQHLVLPVAAERRRTEQRHRASL